MDVETVFDLASLTKPIATATSIMILVERGKIDIDERVAKYMPEFADNGKENVTVRQLLTHTAGLIPDNALDEYNDGVMKAIERFVKINLVSEPDTKFAYSDVGFQILGELVHRVSGKALNTFSHEYIFEPLGMEETTFLPTKSRQHPLLRERAAPTQQREGRWMQGEVHDPRAYKMDGIAGHAGLFSTARDLAVYSSAMLPRTIPTGPEREAARVRSRQVREVQEEFRSEKITREEYEARLGQILRAEVGQRSAFAQRSILREDILRDMTAGESVPKKEPTGIRSLGWDKRTGFSSNRGWNMSPRAFGHGGFTGTGLWIDPGHDLFVIFLSNRVHPDGNGNVNPLIGKIGTIAVDSIVRKQEPPKNRTAKVLEMKNSGKLDKVLTGIDVLKRDNFAILVSIRMGMETSIR